MHRHISIALEDLIRQNAGSAAIRAELEKRGVRECPACGSFYNLTCPLCAAREYRAAHPRAGPAIEPRRYRAYLYREDELIGIEVVDALTGAVDPLALALAPEQEEARKKLIHRLPVRLDEEAETPEEENAKRGRMPGKWGVKNE